MPLSLDDIRHLDAAEGWLEVGHWVDCFDALERIDPLHRSDAAVMALRWNLYNKARQHLIAADLALGIQRRFPDEPAGHIWRSISLEKLGCFQDAYDNLRPIAGKVPRYRHYPVFPRNVRVRAWQPGRGETVASSRVHSARQQRALKRKLWTKRGWSRSGGKIGAI